MGQNKRPRMVQDPFMSDAEFLYRKRQEYERAERAGRQPNLDIGKVAVVENTTTRIGGLARIKDRLDHHERVAEEFKSGYESIFGSGSPSMDPGRVQVDTSPVAHDSGMAGKVDKGRKITLAIEALGAERANLVIAVIVLGVPVRDIARTPHSRDCKSTTSELLMALDCLAVRWGYLTAMPRAS